MQKSQEVVATPKETGFMNFEQLADLILVNRKSDNVYQIPQVFWANCYNYTQNPRLPKYANEFNGYMEAVKDEQRYAQSPAQKKYITDLMNFVTQIQYAAQNPYDSQSVEFMARVKIIIQTYYSKYPSTSNGISNMIPDSAEQYSMLMLAKMGQIKDEQIKYNVLGFFYMFPHHPVSESARQAFIMRANSKYATTQDLYNLMAMYATNPQPGIDINKIFSDVEAMARKNLVAELSKEAPDLDKIKEIISMVRGAANLTKNSEVKANINNIYRLENILLPNAVEYISKAPTADMQKIDGLNKQIQEMTAEVQRLNRELADAKSTLADAQAQNQKLNSENSKLRQDNATLTAGNQSQAAKLRTLIDGAQKMRSGLGSSGVNAYKQLISELEKTK